MRGGETYGVLVNLVELLDGTDSDGTVWAEHVVVFFVVVFDGFECHFCVGSGGHEVGLCLFEFVSGECDLFGGFEGRHPFGQCIAVVSSEMVEVSFKVAGYANVHGWTDGLLDGMTVVLSLGEESVEDVVLIGSYDEFSHG